MTRSRSPRARPDSEIHNDEPYGPSFGSIFGSARAAAPPSYIPPHPQEQTQTINPASLTTTSATPAWVFPPPDTTAAAGTTSASATHAGVTEPILSHDPHIPFPQISAFASWETIGYFLSLHMLHQHVLTPLVHQPSFARDLLHRRDVQDEPFRGLLLSIGESSFILSSLSGDADADVRSGVYVCRTSHWRWPESWLMGAAGSAKSRFTCCWTKWTDPSSNRSAGNVSEQAVRSRSDNK